MEYLMNLSWASTEVIYVGGYAFVIAVSLLTIVFAKRAAQIQDLKQAKIELVSGTQEAALRPAPPPLHPPSLKAANDSAKPCHRTGFPSAA